MSSQSPFHQGEEQVQERAGVREEVESWAPKAIRSFLTDQHRAFFARLPFLVVAARDGAGRPWATLVAGEPGFASSPGPRTLRIDALPSPGDALEGALAEGADVGILGIELHTRRRNRANGRIASRTSQGFVVAVEQGYGNCPRFITPREWRPGQQRPERQQAHRGASVSASQRRLIERADTFFIASGYRAADRDQSGRPERGSALGMDASHRGGPPGFVRVEDERHLIFPDYAGNNLFNTLGNLVADPRAGLLFVDFSRGDLLQITGRAAIEWSPPAAARDAGAERLVRIEIEETVELAGALPLQWGPARATA